MKPALALAVVSAVVLTSFSAAAADPAAAKKNLEAARANLAKAVQRIEKDPPSQADLDAALAAVGALKDAIDAGASNEGDDLDYAKSALAARKELRTHREYVDQRRSQVHLFNSRRTVDGALNALGDRMKRLEAKAPSSKEFEDARAALAAARKALGDAQQYAKEDAKFASYLGEADATVDRQEKAIEDRSVQLAIDKHRGLLEESRKGLASAMTVLGKGASDSQFDNAEKAATALSKRLDEGKPFEAKDKAYRADAEKARAELEKAQKKADDLWAETALARVKGEIEPAHKDLIAAGKAVRARNATEDQLAEAKTAAIVVRKLVDKFQPQAARNPAFGNYLNDVKKTLIDVEIELQRRNLDAARADAVQALKLIEKPAATDENFKEAEAALNILEKTIEGAHTTDPAMVKPVADARALLRDGRASIAKRRSGIELEANRKELSSARAAVTQGLRLIEKRAPTDENFQELNTALSVLEKTLEAMKRPDPALAQQVSDARTLLRDARATAAKRRGELDLDSERGKLDSAKKSVVQALRLLEKRAPTEENFQEVNTALSVLEKTIEAAQASKVAGLGAHVADARTLLRDGRATAAKRHNELDVDAKRRNLDAVRGAAVQALRLLEKRAPTDENFDEANTALTILEKTLEGIQKPAPGLAESVAASRTWLRDGRATMAKRRLEVDVQRQQAKVEEARKNANNLMKAIYPRDVEEAQFQEASTGLDKILEALKAGEAFVKKDGGYAAYDREVKQRVAEMKEGIAKRRLEVAVMRQKAKVEEARRNATALVGQIADNAGAQEAETALQQLGEALEAGAALTKKDREYGAYDREVRKRIAELADRLGKRKIQLAANDGRALVFDAINVSKSKLHAAKEAGATDKDLDAAAKSVDAVVQALDERAPLEEQDRGYAAQADKARDELSNLKRDLEFVKQAHALRQRTVAALAAGVAASNAAAGARDVRKQKEQYEKAVAQFSSCESGGASMIDENRALAQVAVLVDGHPSTPKDVIGLCAQRGEATKQALNKVEGLIAFEEGPKRAYEKAKDSSGKEAIAQFDECIATGTILQHRNPELKDRKFQVGRENLTLVELVGRCTKERKALAGK